MTADDKSLGDAATHAGAKGRLARDEVSLGDERTFGGGDAAGVDTILEDIEIVDLETRYKVEGTLGQGGMGAVVLATDTRLGRKVAIKRILGEAARNKTAMQRFLTEARSIAAISHPNVVQIYELGVAKDGPFLIIEYVEGGSLLDRCKAAPLTADEAVRMIGQVCDGLGRAHALGIIHRDIKPANVLLTKDGTPKLTDFGLAKAEAADHQMTMTGAVMGTPDFMPPEQRRDAALVDHRSDLWSLAATLYQAVTGKSPKVIRLHELPSDLQPILSKALEDDKEARYQSAGEFREALLGIGTAAKQPKHVKQPERIDGVLQEGQCRACGTITSDLSKKFCRNPACGASLRVPCLKCDTQIPVWDGVCGECGGNQPAILDSRRGDLAAKQARAESLAREYDFPAALHLAAELSGQSHPDLADFVAWAGSFVESTEAEKARQEALAAEKVREAEAHRNAFDYPAAIHALEAVPQPLRSAGARSLLETCQSRKNESDALVATIADRITRKDLGGLLPLVERSVELRGDRKDLAKIRGQLIERRDGRVARAIAAMEAGDARAAAAAFAGAVEEDFTTDQQALLARVTRAIELEAEIARLVKEAKADATITPEEAAGILDAAAQYLALNPKNEQIRRLTRQTEGIAKPVLAARQRDRMLSQPPIENSIGIRLKLLPAGTFTMGQAGGDKDETPHEVTLTKPFYMGVYEVTNAQWKRVMGSEPSNWKDDDRPVEQVSWDDANEFCRRLSALPEEKRAGRVYRLPTEAEWEYACRAGTTTKWSFGDDESGLGDYAWFKGNSGSQTHAVGKKKPNAWGLFDMHGNVWEWCSDWYGDYAKAAVTDPQGPSGGSIRVFRGGSWCNSAGHCRSAFRNGNDPSFRLGDLGFRLALSPSGAEREPPEAAIRK